MTAQYDVISAWIARWEEHFVEPVVFGTTDPQQIACLIDAFCQRELAAAVADYLFYESSQGTVCGMRLVDGRRVVLKEPRLTPDGEAKAFIAEYELARGKPFTADEWQTLKAVGAPMALAVSML